MTPLLRYLSSACAALALVVTNGPAFAAPATGSPGTHAAPATYVAPRLQNRMAADPNAALPVIVQMRSAPSQPSAPAATARTGHNDEAENAVGLLRQHGKAGSALGILGGASGHLKAGAIRALANNPNVAAIYEDRIYQRTAVSDANLVAAYPAVVNAPAAWQQNTTGAGITVAVLDSGINPDPDIAGRILASVNFADPATTSDPGGHGTHVAGIIAGDGTMSAGQYIGVAPQANLVDVRVMDAKGNATTSSVIAGLQWTISHAGQYGIRVVNLSLGGTPVTDYAHDPVAAVAEIAWLHGLVVVAAAGNNGTAVDTPGIDPHLLTVGALDDQGTSSLADDVIPTWSGWGVPTGSTSKPDIVAPGRRIVSLRVPGSTLDVLNPDRVVTAANGAQYFRMSGTSMATGVASGVVALLLQAHPGLKPNQVKGILTATAAPFGQLAGVSVPGPIAGRGVLDEQAASLVATALSGNHGLRVANPAAQTLYPLLNGQPLVWKNPTLNGIDWSQFNWTNLVWDDFAWDNLVWDNFAWDSLNWDSLSWTNFAWDSLAWASGSWDAIVPSATNPD
jgi:serine protease AprX